MKGWGGGGGVGDGGACNWGRRLKLETKPISMLIATHCDWFNSSSSACGLDVFRFTRK